MQRCHRGDLARLLLFSTPDFHRRGRIALRARCFPSAPAHQRRVLGTKAILQRRLGVSCNADLQSRGADALVQSMPPSGPSPERTIIRPTFLLLHAEAVLSQQEACLSVRTTLAGSLGSLVATGHLGPQGTPTWRAAREAILRAAPKASQALRAPTWPPPALLHAAVMAVASSGPSGSRVQSSASPCASPRAVCAPFKGLPRTRRCNTPSEWDGGQKRP